MTDESGSTTLITYILDVIGGVIAAIVLPLSGFIAARVWAHSERLADLQRNIVDLRDTEMRIHAEDRASFAIIARRLDTIEERLRVIDIAIARLTLHPHNIDRLPLNE